MARNYEIISGDTHLEIDTRRWRHRVPEQHRDRLPHVVRLPDGGDAWRVEGEALREVPMDLYAGKGRDVWKPFGQNYETTRGTGAPEQRLQEQDADHIDAEVLFPGISGPPMWRSVRDDDAYLAIVRGYNEYLAQEYCAADPDRLIGLGVIPWTGIEDAVRELEYCKQIGLKGIALGTFPNGKGYPTAEDDRFWAATQDLEIAVTVHQEFNRSGPRGGATFDYPQGKDVLKRLGPTTGLVEQMAKFGRAGGVNAIQMVLSGIFDRFPKLRVFFAETQAGWVPFFYEMADQRYNRHSHWGSRIFGVAPLRRQPSEYMRDHVLWGFQWDRVGVETRHRTGVNSLIWATDFPHQESEWPNSLDVIERQFFDVPEAEKRRMVRDNALEFFHLEQSPLATGSAREAVAVR